MSLLESIDDAHHEEEKGHEREKESHEHEGEKQASAGGLSFERIPVAKGSSDVGYTEITLLKDIPAGSYRNS